MIKVRGVGGEKKIPRWGRRKEVIKWNNTGEKGEWTVAGSLSSSTQLHWGLCSIGIRHALEQRKIRNIRKGKKEKGIPELSPRRVFLRLGHKLFSFRKFQWVKRSLFQGDLICLLWVRWDIMQILGPWGIPAIFYFIFVTAITTTTLFSCFAYWVIRCRASYFRLLCELLTNEVSLSLWLGLHLSVCVFRPTGRNCKAIELKFEG